ncbi:hypothetical protein [Streptomyces roseoverticillatus]|uniref:Helix-turn-helix domain-containing protein n=1 Tax=Streptomyces roseoverticillatus TaxID=66429 RepID=A0ABV3J5X7_9ACTN
MARSGSTHSNTPPDLCASCRAAYGLLDRHHREQPDQPLTGAAIAEALGLSRRTALVHVGYLAESGLLGPDRRTPTGAGLRTAEPRPALPSPVEWAATLSLTCRTCGRLMLVLTTAAGREWVTQMSESDLASALGVTGRTVREHMAALTGHRPHARHHLDAPLLRTERIPGTGGRGGLRITLLTGVIRPGSVAEDYSPAEYAELRTRALAVLDQAPVAARMTARERVRAAELLIIPRLHTGYPAAAVLAAMTDPTDTPETAHTTAYGLIKHRLLKRAPEGPYVPTAREAYDLRPVVHDCAGCGEPIKAALHITHCRDCRLRERAGISLDAAALIRPTGT